MINYLKSEKIKWKGSHAFYLILVLSLLQLMTIPPYMMVVKNSYCRKYSFFSDVRVSYIDCNSFNISARTGR